jgi:hypothetical protein
MTLDKYGDLIQEKFDPIRATDVTTTNISN